MHIGHIGRKQEGDLQKLKMLSSGWNAHLVEFELIIDIPNQIAISISIVWKRSWRIIFSLILWIKRADTDSKFVWVEIACSKECL
jgi:hypothetical protein